MRNEFNSRQPQNKKSSTVETPTSSYVSQAGSFRMKPIRDDSQLDLFNLCVTYDGQLENGFMVNWRRKGDALRRDWESSKLEKVSNVIMIRGLEKGKTYQVRVVKLEKRQQVPSKVKEVTIDFNNQLVEKKNQDSNESNDEKHIAKITLIAERLVNNALTQTYYSIQNYHHQIYSDCEYNDDNLNDDSIHLLHENYYD